MDLRTDIEHELHEFVRTYDASGTLKINGEALCGFADVEHPYIRELPDIVHKLHQMPREVMPDATVIMVYFVPFQPWGGRRKQAGEMASADWAQIYEETNAMFPKTQCTHDRFSESRGYRGAVSPQSTSLLP